MVGGRRRGLVGERGILGFCGVVVVVVVVRGVDASGQRQRLLGCCWLSRVGEGARQRGVGGAWIYLCMGGSVGLGMMVCGYCRSL